MQTNYKKIIFTTLLFTLIAIIVTFAIVSLLLVFVFTSKLADFFYSMGNEKIASSLYYRAYEKNDDINLCYKALNLKIKIDDEESIVEIYDVYLKDDEYNSFNELMKSNNEHVDCSPLERSVILNDKNYLENKYISALIDLGKEKEAFDRAIANFSDYKNYNFENQGLYNLNYFINNKSLYNNTYDGYTDKLVIEMQKYFDQSVKIFEENIDSEGELNTAYLISLGNRLVLVGQNINTIYSANGENSDLISANAEKMTDINETIKGLIA